MLLGGLIDFSVNIIFVSLALCISSNVSPMKFLFREVELSVPPCALNITRSLSLQMAPSTVLQLAQRRVIVRATRRDIDGTAIGWRNTPTGGGGVGDSCLLPFTPPASSPLNRLPVRRPLCPRSVTQLSFPAGRERLWRSCRTAGLSIVRKIDE